jgi:pimeloyl-ACP methyl ester carboxylesterase
MEMSIIDECSDLKAVVEHFRNSKDVDPDRIVLLGESQGGLVSALVANEIPDAVDKLILVFPAFCIPDNWNRRYPDVNEIPDTTWLWEVPLGRRFFQEIRDMSVFDGMENYDGPVLIVQGDNDPVVSMEDSQRAVGLYENAHLHVIPGAGHGFKPDEFEEQLEQMRIFLK